VYISSTGFVHVGLEQGPDRLIVEVEGKDPVLTAEIVSHQIRVLVLLLDVGQEATPRLGRSRLGGKDACTGETLDADEERSKST
jgi:hypothetical protein